MLVHGRLRFGLLFPTLLIWSHAAQADPLAEARDKAESLVLQAFCKDGGAGTAKSLAHLSLATDDGIACGGRIIRELSTATLLTDTYLLDASWNLWNLVDHAVATERARPRVRLLLDAIQGDVAHPLRSEAWLALRILDRAEGKLALVSGRLPYLYVPRTHDQNLLPPTAEDLKAKLDTAHPTLRRELAWVLANDRRSQISEADSAHDKLQLLLALDDSFSMYGETNYDFVAAYVDTIFQDNILTTTKIKKVEGGTNAMPPMQFTLTGSYCADGNCKPLNISGSAITNVRVDATKGLSPDPSWSSVYVPYLMTNSFGSVIASYSAGIQSNIRGGYWTEKTLGVVTKTGDGTSTVDYTLRGTTTIPKCDNPVACSVTVHLASSLMPSEAGKGTSVSLSVDGPPGKTDLPAGNYSTEIDRTLGDYKIEVVLHRNASNTGGCCYEWVAQAFSLSLFKSGAAPGSLLSFGLPDNHDQAGAFSIPAWVDPKLAEDLLPYGYISGQIRHRMDTGGGQPNILFAEPLGHPVVTYERRFGALWSRLVFSRLGLEWLNATLSPIEKNELAALNNSLSEAARDQLTGPLRAELQAYSYVQESLDTSPLLLVMAALTRDTGLVDDLDVAEAQIISRIAAAKSTVVSDHLKAAKDALDYVRAGSPRADALLRLAAAQYAMFERTIEAKTRYDKISRELAQLWGAQ